MAPKAVLFDMFDTLFMILKNHEFYEASLKRMYNFLVTQGINTPYDKFNQTYITERDAIYAAADKNCEDPHFNVRVSNTLKKLSYNYDVSSPLVTAATEQFYLEFMNFVKIDQNTKPVLQTLYGKYKLGLVSNFAIPECVQKLLQNENVDSLFDVIVVSGAINKRKPSPVIFNNALDSIGVLASEAVFVGDTPDADVAGAQGVGMKAVYIERRFEAGLKLVTPDRVITSLLDLPNVIEF
ncbi:MAG: HAD family hydrolase [Candidatus Bathyarchaeota archaeon]|nr:HAD family hydrolase [Candidatus Bathyarchaeota archaeon]